MSSRLLLRMIDVIDTTEPPVLVVNDVPCNGVWRGDHAVFDHFPASLIPRDVTMWVWANPRTPLQVIVDLSRTIIAGDSVTVYLDQHLS